MWLLPRVRASVPLAICLLVAGSGAPVQGYGWSVVSIDDRDPGYVAGPWSVAVNIIGTLFAAARSSHSIVQFTPLGWKSVAGKGRKPGEVWEPQGLVASGMRLSVAEGSGGGLGNDRVQVFSVRPNPATPPVGTVLAEHGSEVGCVENPNALALDGFGSLYVSDPDNHRIQKRVSDRKWEVIAGPGTMLGQVWDPLALASVGRVLYVAETYNGALGTHRVQCRDEDGSWSLIAGPGRDLGQVLYPHGLAADDRGNLYVADWGNNWIQKRDRKGRWSVVALPGREPYQVNLPSGLAVDRSRTLYVADYGNDRVLKYEPGPLADHPVFHQGPETPITIADLLRMLRWLAGNPPPTEAEAEDADLNCDGRFDTRDLILLLRLLAGLEGELPC
ncbi:MAG TPA: hypothetical protein VGN26_13305 [Armatimonadota bacterium]|jgi:hypothetical protein